MLLNASTENQRAVIDAYKTLQTEPHTSTWAAEQTVSMGSPTSARCCSDSLARPPHMLLLSRTINSSDRRAILPCPVHPAGWSTLTLTHSRCMHIWPADSEFPDILRARQLTGYWHTHSREKPALCGKCQRTNPG